MDAVVPFMNKYWEIVVTITLIAMFLFYISLKMYIKEVSYSEENN